jgi:hypothetical protein
MAAPAATVYTHKDSFDLLTTLGKGYAMLQPGEGTYV